MGYNGGTNKRGYYRRNNGMYSKSSMKSGSRIFTNFLLGSIGLIGSLGKALLEESNNISDVKSTNNKQSNPKQEKIKYIIFFIIAILCPIIGYILFYYANWSMFFSILIFGFIETIMCLITIPILNENNPIYKTQNGSNIKKRTINIIRCIYITLFILNLYPFISDYFFDLPITLIFFKLFLNCLFIKDSFHLTYHTSS